MKPKAYRVIITREGGRLRASVPALGLTARAVTSKALDQRLLAAVTAKLGEPEVRLTYETKVGEFVDYLDRIADAAGHALALTSPSRGSRAGGTSRTRATASTVARARGARATSGMRGASGIRGASGM